jgi:hypothetical protein
MRVVAESDDPAHGRGFALSLAFRSLLIRSAGRAGAVLLSATLVATASVIAAPAIGRSGPTAPVAAPVAAARTVAPVSTTSAPVANESAIADSPGLLPSIQYEEAEAHRNDAIAFAAGGRVKVGFTPRASDRWTVGGVDPETLPAGRLDGKAMRARSANDAVEHDPWTTSGVDLPTATRACRADRRQTPTARRGCHPAVPPRILGSRLKRP